MLRGQTDGGHIRVDNAMQGELTLSNDPPLHTRSGKVSRWVLLTSILATALGFVFRQKWQEAKLINNEAAQTIPCSLAALLKTNPVLFRGPKRQPPVLSSQCTYNFNICIIS